MTLEALIVFVILPVALDVLSNNTVTPLALTTDIPLEWRLILVARESINHNTLWRNAARGSLG